MAAIRVHRSGQSTRTWRFFFTVAGAYNLLMGATVIARPNIVFNFCGAPPLNYPSVMQGLAMVIGLYGLGYLHIARRPHEGEMLAFIGLLGRIGGPIAWAFAVRAHELPLSSLPFIIINDLLWIPGFLEYLSWAHTLPRPAECQTARLPRACTVSIYER